MMIYCDNKENTHAKNIFNCINHILYSTYMSENPVSSFLRVAIYSRESYYIKFHPMWQ